MVIYELVIQLIQL